MLTSTDLEDEINEYCDAMEDFGQARTGLVAAVATENNSWATYEDPDYMDPPYMVAPIGKAKCKEKGNNGDRKGDGKGGKGKLHKGMGKSPDRAEYRRFGGMCNWCCRVGHKETACWFKQEYERTSGKPHAAAAASPANPETPNKDT